MLRTNDCGELRLKDLGKNVKLTGWVKKIRKHGSVTFIDLWDRYGTTQIIVNRDENVSRESVLLIEGKVQERSSKNPKMPTGDIEINAEKIEVLAKAEGLPLEIGDPNNTDLTRLRYRYLDLRRDEMIKNIIIRSKTIQAINEYLTKNNFIHIETPIMAKSTPEGARDYLVPSRIKKGSFYALPQSPQLFKQILMIAGFDRYYQIARCFRDEDLRADRQPEFTQIDIEMSYIEEHDIQTVTEEMFVHIFKEVFNIDIEKPFKKLTFKKADDEYGSDKPDLRYGLKLKDISDLAKLCDFNVLASAETVKCLVIGPSENTKEVDYSRKKIEELTKEIVKYGAKGIIYLKYTGNELEGPMAKHIEKIKENLIEKLSLKKQDSILIIAGNKKVVNRSLGELRKIIAKELDLCDKNKFEFVWVTDFPMFEYNEEEERWQATHHPFTQPKIETLDEIENKETCKAKAYDLVLNGEEVAGGSIRINTIEMQNKVFESIGISKEKAREKFGFLLEALKYGAPPHGGIAFGFDRIMAIMLKIENHDIREVIPFPKTKNAEDVMTGAPSEIFEEQLKDVGLKLEK
ncbi:aspartate--tRNA ligase [Candidatus Micrarchaeota archaeon]|nr:aspartate--tRNA ligase [Candidatus Micrarchaeota archaeon]